MSERSGDKIQDQRWCLLGDTVEDRNSRPVSVSLEFTEKRNRRQSYVSTRSESAIQPISDRLVVFVTKGWRQDVDDDHVVGREYGDTPCGGLVSPD
jgi:hypothetical protein